MTNDMQTTTENDQQISRISEVVEFFNRGYKFTGPNDSNRCYLCVRYTGSHGYLAHLLNVFYSGKGEDGFGDIPAAARGTEGSPTAESAVDALIVLLSKNKVFRLGSPATKDAPKRDGLSLTLSSQVENDYEEPQPKAEPDALEAEAA